MTVTLPVQEGTIPFRGYRTWYRIVGEDRPGRLPLLCLHDDGAPPDDLSPLEALAATGRRVILYHQLGGDAALVHDPSLWSVDLFVEEMGGVRGALGLEALHILGQSWGGLLALGYALTGPRGVASLVIADSPTSLPRWAADIVARLAEIHAPTLILSGRYDEATPPIAETAHRGIPGSEWVQFEGRSAMPHGENTERCLAVVGDFLRRVEVRMAGGEDEGLETADVPLGEPTEYTVHTTREIRIAPGERKIHPRRPAPPVPRGDDVADETPSPPTELT